MFIAGVREKYEVIKEKSEFLELRLNDSIEIMLYDISKYSGIIDIHVYFHRTPLYFSHDQGCFLVHHTKVLPLLNLLLKVPLPSGIWSLRSLFDE